MSEKVILELEVKSAAAKADTDALTAAMLASLDASEAAGKGQKGLGKATGETRAQNLAAKEAMQAQSDAQRTLTLTMQAFGKNSKEAAAAAQALAKATVEAKVAQTAAAVSVSKTAQAVTAAAIAEDGKLSPATKRAAAAIERMGKESERATAELHRMDLQAIAAAKGSDKLSKGLSAMTVAGGALVAIGISKSIEGLVGGLKSAGAQAIDFQTQMTGIAKVLDDQSPENLARVDAQIKSMAVSLGVLPVELGKMTQALAASGLQDDLVGYTEDAAKLGVAFDLTGEEAGHAIASLTASLGLSRTEMQSLMNTINELDDNMNSSSKQLVEYLEGVAGIGRSASISGETMLALGSAIISTGAAPDKAATGVKNFIATMEAGSAATDAQISAFGKLGLKAEEVAKMMATGRAEEQIKAVSTALAGLKPEEKFGVMIDLFGRESIGSIGGLATGVELLGKSFEIAGNKAAAAGSVQAEYERVSQTTAHTLAQLKANVSVAAIEIGGVLLPEINKVAKDMSAWVSQNRELLKTNVAAAVQKITTVARELWPVLKTVASTVASVTEAVGAGNLAYIGMAGKLAGLTGGLGGLASSMAGAASKMVTSMVPALAGVGGKLAALAGPAGLLALATAGVAALSFAALKYLFPVESAFDKIALAALNAERRMRDVRIEAMRDHAGKLSAANAKQAEENAKQQRAIDAGFSNDGRAEAVRKAGLAERKRLLDEKGTKLDVLQVEEVRLKIQKAMADEAERYNRAATDAGNGIVSPTALNSGPSDKEKRASASAGRKAAAADKHDNAFARDLMDFDSEVATYAAKQAKELREADLKSQQDALDDSLKAQEIAQERAMGAFDQEKALLDAGTSAREDNAAAHESIIARKLAADEKYARKQLALAKTEEGREKARTALNNVEHGKRLLVVQRAQRLEEAAYKKRLAIVDQVTSGVTGLTGAMATAVMDGALKTKGALAEVLASELKTTAKSYAIKSAAAFASAAIAAAGVVTAPLAPGYVAAGVMAAGVAAAAGGGAAIAGAVAKARAPSKPDDAADLGSAYTEADKVAFEGKRGGGQSNSGGGGAGEKFEKSEVPVSFNDRKPPQSRGGGDRVFNITVNVGNLMGEADKKKLGQDLSKLIREAESGGKRY